MAASFTQQRPDGAGRTTTVAEQIVAGAAAIIPGVWAAAVETVDAHGHLQAAVSHGDEVARAVMDAQNTASQGPAWTAGTPGEQTVVLDMVADGRWPALAALLTPIGVRSMLCTPVTIALAGRLTPNPAWTRHAGGPWPQTHELAMDLSGTPAGWQWLDGFALQASADIAAAGQMSRSVVAHADWYAGNVLFQEDRVVAVFDWQLYTEQEAVVVGLTAGGYLTDDAPTPEQVAGYLDDYDAVSSLPARGRETAVAADRWMLSFNARCDLAVLTDEPAPGSALHRLAEQRRRPGRRAAGVDRRPTPLRRSEGHRRR